jgi:nuclear pore complex protein Nup205
MEELESLRGLHQDLVALSASCLYNVERLRLGLEAHIEDFRKLLDKKSRSDESRKTLKTGKY